MDLNLSKSFPKYNSPTVAAPKSRSSLEVVLLLIIAVLFYLFLLQPKTEQLTDRKATVAKLTEDKRKAEQNKKQLESMVSQLKKHQADVVKLDEALPLDSRVSKVYLLLEDLAQKSAMTVSNLSVSGADGRVVAGNQQVIEEPYKIQRKLQKFSITMSVTGSFEQFLELLNRLETSGRILNVTSVDVIASTDTKLDFSLTMETYSYE